MAENYDIPWSVSFKALSTAIFQKFKSRHSLAAAETNTKTETNKNEKKKT